eukprot:TRINITY_DN3834_c0_g1_i2.p2 TRINITY_DN3834_c0_g1~~TRINITY_DN3834_c0_g1_i2.p2  ORF type:complete len:122 (-),score=26.18 TRINITY_DN3834_c0_g1_i2:23-388(-)
MSWSFADREGEFAALEVPGPVLPSPPPEAPAPGADAGKAAKETSGRKGSGRGGNDKGAGAAAGPAAAAFGAVFPLATLAADPRFALAAAVAAMASGKRTRDALARAEAAWVVCIMLFDTYL